MAIINFVIIIITSSNSSFLRLNFKIYIIVSNIISSVTARSTLTAMPGIDSVPSYLTMVMLMLEEKKRKGEEKEEQLQ